jgi:peptidoglycan hydrolase-like protein with peptidoglycan-binding domain
MVLRSRRLSSVESLQDASDNDPPLQKGDSGDGVAALQDLLGDLTFRLPRSFASGKPDGIFGSETEAAVKRLQRKYRLKPDGIVGTRTLHVLDVLILTHNALETPDPGRIAHRDALDRTLPLFKRTKMFW